MQEDPFQNKKRILDGANNILPVPQGYRKTQALHRGLRQEDNRQTVTKGQIRYKEKVFPHKDNLAVGEVSK